MKVLVVGIYRTDAPTLYYSIAETFRKTRHDLTMYWHGMVPGVGKFEMINGMLEEVGDQNPYDYIIVTDDDITFQADFLDRYLDIVEHCDFALAQPARTNTSSIHHDIVRQRPSMARQTRFVEIGPLFSIRRDLAPLMVPFAHVDETPMGWGFCFTWPLLVEGAGLRMGIVDETPVEHSIRPDLLYPVGVAGTQMVSYLLAHPHLPREEAYQTLAVYERIAPNG